MSQEPFTETHLPFFNFNEFFQLNPLPTLIRTLLPIFKLSPRTWTNSQNIWIVECQNNIIRPYFGGLYDNFLKWCERNQSIYSDTFTQKSDGRSLHEIVRYSSPLSQQYDQFRLYQYIESPNSLTIDLFVFVEDVAFLRTTKATDLSIYFSITEPRHSVSVPSIIADNHRRAISKHTQTLIAAGGVYYTKVRNMLSTTLTHLFRELENLSDQALTDVFLTPFIAAGIREDFGPHHFRSTVVAPLYAPTLREILLQPDAASMNSDQLINSIIIRLNSLNLFAHLYAS